MKYFLWSEAGELVQFLNRNPRNFDERLESLSDNFGQLGVCGFDERAGGISDLLSGIVPTLAVTISGTVCGDDDLLGRSLRFFEGRSA